MPVDTGDTAFILASAALVMLMTPALGFFYGGLVRRKNVLSIIMRCLVSLAIVSIIWVLWGYSLAFGPDRFGLIGGTEWLGFAGVGAAPSLTYATTVPHEAYAIFQLMFAAITPALITGAFADRVKFRSYVAFLIIWSTLVYVPIAHWVWGDGGWLRKLGTLDFAGGTVVHINAGVAALAAALVVGKRKGFGRDPMLPHNVPYVVIGTTLLWFGWFGFNAGSALTSGAIAANAFLATQLGASAAAVSWLSLDWLTKGRPSVVGMCTGAVAGLVAITPAAGFVNPPAAIVIGAGASLVCYFAILLKARSGLDDALDVWGVHGVGGTFGALMTGVFATTLVNPNGGNGLIYGNPSQLGVQAVAVGVVWVYTFVLTLLILKLLDRTLRLRVDEKEEALGLDMAQHGEEAYGEGMS
jgi:Amt family ammonium transporter